jgi:Family of unknown function (DUF5808)
MTTSYLRAVGAHLDGLGRADRAQALEALAAQLDELNEAGVDPLEVLGPPERYAAELVEALIGDVAAEEPRFRVFGIPIETRGLLNGGVRSRIFDPENPRIIVPRLLGAGWTLNLGAVAVKLKLIRPDDATSEVFEQVPERAVRIAQFVPAAVAGVAAGVVAVAWRGLPDRVPSSFDLGGRTRGSASKFSLVAGALMGVLPAVWALRQQDEVEDRLVDASSATMLASISVSTVAASVLNARNPQGRWGLAVPAMLPAAVAASLAVIVLPLRAGLRRVWRDAEAPASTPSD